MKWPWGGFPVTVSFQPHHHHSRGFEGGFAAAHLSSSFLRIYLDHHHLKQAHGYLKMQWGREIKGNKGKRT
jgi:hypothetical protein